MNEMASYLLTLICGAFICALIKAIAPDSPGKGTRELLCGLFLALLALSPIRTLEIPRWELMDFQSEAEAFAMDGAGQAIEERNSIISRQMEAYICNRAEELGLNITAQVMLDDAGFPESVIVRGTWTEEQKERFCSVITSELGILEEAQSWTKRN